MQKLNLYGPLSNQIGYGIVSHEILKGLVRNDVDLTYWPVNDNVRQIELDQADAPIVQAAIDNQRNFDSSSGTLSIWHQNRAEKRIGLGLNAILSFFEKNELSDYEVNVLKSQDVLIAPSRWAETVYQKYFPASSVRYVPMGVDTDLFRPLKINKETEDYIFLNVGKIEKRKGHDVLVDIFNAAFEERDRVQLWISWNNPFLSPEDIAKWENAYKSSKLGHKIKFLPRVPRQELVRLYNTVDCGIFPTRAEGLGLPILEMMACGKPVITTNYSAITDYCNKDTSFLVDIDEMEPAIDGVWFNGEGNWAKFGPRQIEQFIHCMRNVYNYRLSSLYSAQEFVKQFSWDATVSAIKDIYR